MAVPYNIEKVLEQFTKEIKGLFGKETISVIVFGSAVTEEFDPRKSDLNFLVVLSEKGIKQVDKCFWVKKFGVDYLKRQGNYIITDARYYEELFFLQDFAAKNPNTLEVVFIYVNRTHPDVNLNVDGSHPDVYTKCGMKLKKSDADYVYENFENNEGSFNNLVEYVSS